MLCGPSCGSVELKLLVADASPRWEPTEQAGMHEVSESCEDRMTPAHTGSHLLHFTNRF